MLNNKTFLRIFSLVAAVLLWVFVMIEEDPYKTTKIREIPITFANEEELAEDGLAPIANDDMEITARIKGKRSQINDIEKAGLTAYVDVSLCSKGENSKNIIINVPDGIVVESMSDESLTFSVEKLVEEERILSLEFLESSSDSNKVPWVISSEENTVTVVGAKSLVNKVDRVKGIVSAENISEQNSSWADVSVKPVDKYGKIVPDVSVIDKENIRAEIMLLALKTVELDIDVDNIEDGFELDKIDSSDKIKIVGSEDALKDIKEVQGIADMQGTANSGINKIKVNLKLPEGIYLYNESNPLTVKIKLKTVE